MTSRIFCLILVLLAAFGLAGAGCGRTETQPYKETKFLMDTVIDITAYGPGAKEAVEAAFAEFIRIHNMVNVFDEQSEAARINRHAGKSKVRVSPELIGIIKRSNALADKLEGKFDVTIGALTELWGIGHKGDFVPGDAAIAQVLPIVNYRTVEIDEAENTIFLPKSGMRLDLGGVAKGYATDRAVEVLKAKGIKSALVNAGGDVKVIGARPDSRPWRIGVQDPRKSDGVIAKLAMTEWDTMVTSGDYQRYIINNGQRYAHILDPATGKQPREIISVTLATNNSGDGDIIGTAVFVLGVKRGLELLGQFPGTEAVIVTANGEIVITPGLEGKVEISK